MLDRLIFGDNQFFGVSHMSEERGIERMRRFQHNDAIIKVLDSAYDAGIHAFSFSTHDRVSQICDHFRAHPKRYDDLRLYPALPYAQKYAHLVNEKGVFGAISDVIFSGNTAKQIFHTITRGSKAVVTQDPAEVMRLMVDAELKMFRGLNVKVIFLQNIVTDLILGFDIPELFIEFANHIREKYHAEPGFITLNMPRLVDLLLKAGFENPIVCSAINKMGFQMNPNREAYERTLSEKPFNAIAMSVLAAGALPPQQAFEYIGALRGVKSVMFGASTEANIIQTKMMIEKQCKLNEENTTTKS